MKAASGSTVEAIFLRAAVEAGRAIMEAVGRRLRATAKADGSPVTDADLKAEEIIRARLSEALPGLRIVGEEEGAPGPDEQLPSRFVLVDPLDGTRDCLAGSPEFTVNIALIEDGRPVIGVVHAPALGRLFLGSAAGGAWEIAMPGALDVAEAPRRAIRVRQTPSEGLVALQSRSHREPATDAALAAFGSTARRAVASSLKFALIAAGEGDLYVRAVSLNEWDIAAGDAVLTAAGGAVLSFAGEPLRYGRVATALRAAPFVASGDPTLRRPMASADGV